MKFGILKGLMEFVAVLKMQMTCLRAQPERYLPYPISQRYSYTHEAWKVLLQLAK